MVRHFLTENFNRNWLTRLSALAAMPVLKRFRRKFDPRRYNGASLLGLRGIVIKSDGSADVLAFENAIHIAEKEIHCNIPERIAHRVGGQLDAERQQRPDRVKLYSRILGTGSYLPKKILTNKDIEEIVDTTDEWIFDLPVSVSAMCGRGGDLPDLAWPPPAPPWKPPEVEPSEIALIVLATDDAGDLPQHGLDYDSAPVGIKGAPAFDVQAVCAGLSMPSVSDQYIRTGSAEARRAIGADTMSRLLDWQDCSTCILSPMVPAVVLAPPR